MAVKTFLLDFKLDPKECETDEQCLSLLRSVEQELTDWELECSFQTATSDGGFFELLSGPSGLTCTLRLYKAKGFLTLTFERPETGTSRLVCDQTLMELVSRVKKRVSAIDGLHLQPIKRFSDVNPYYGTSGLTCTLRLYKAKGFLTLTFERPETGTSRLVCDQTLMELVSRVKKRVSAIDGLHLQPIKRFSDVNPYYGTSDERILEYDFDKELFSMRTPFQMVQILHSANYGNTLILDDFINLSEADLVYTQTLMRLGKECYADKEILILGGGDGALLHELLKEKPKFVTMVDIDEVVMQQCRIHMRSVCGDVLDNYETENYKIIVGDAIAKMQDYIKEGKTFDYVFGDLTDIPVSATPVGELWDFFRRILGLGIKCLRPDGKYLMHGNGKSSSHSLAMFEKQLELLEPKVKWEKWEEHIPSFRECWVFYQIQLAS
ncbi:unnamed protein product [Cyprideis torosa]|uniref:Uncharacterized protein n=1 Tax=Cyprideis torosa TaxID=163714 RepID=A0A7R8ZPN6_9CRUS|nr:unnamed protein product [Cyprideis torosa]CAG0888743.1 unnamed protein product [Cyprideis torosa]